MRGLLVRGLLLGVLGASVLGAASLSTASPSALRGGSVDDASRFSLSVEGIPDSILWGGEAPRRDQLWGGAALTELAGRVRDRLLGLGRYDATIRLAMVPGSGSTPGTASLSLLGNFAPGVGARAVAVVKQGTPPGLSDVVKSFERGSQGATSPGAIAAGVAAVKDDAVEAGFYAASVSVDSVVGAGAVTQVYLNVIPGPPIVVESLEIPGAMVTRQSAAVSISGLKPGRRVTPALLSEGKERLVGSDLFVSVGDPRVLPGREPGRARVVIPVEETNASRFEGAIGVAKGGGLTGLIDLGLGNIGGSGRSAGLRWAGLGDGVATYAIRYREPALLGRPIDGSFALDADVVDSLFTQTRWAISFGGRPAPRARGSMGFAHTGSVYSGMGRGSSETWSVLGRLEWQGLLPHANPSRGVAAGLTFEAGNRTERYPGLPELKRPVLRGAASLAAVASLGGPRVLYGSVRAEQVSFEGGDFPAEELRYLGGSEGLRGHRDRAYAGNRILKFNFEQRWITDPRGGRAYLFLDVARHSLDAPLSAGVALVPGAMTSLARTELSDGWELGYGAGLKTPVASGVAGLELGLSPGAALRQATIHVRYASSW